MRNFLVLRSEINYFLYIIETRVSHNDRIQVENTLNQLLNYFLLSPGIPKYCEIIDLLNTINYYVSCIKKIDDKDCLLIESDIPLLLSLEKYLHYEINNQNYK